MDEGGGLEVLYARRAREGPFDVAPNGLAAKQDESGARALAARGHEARERLVEIALEVAVRRRLVGGRGRFVLGKVRLDDGTPLGEVRREGAAPVAVGPASVCRHV